MRGRRRASTPRRSRSAPTATTCTSSAPTTTTSATSPSSRGTRTGRSRSSRREQLHRRAPVLGTPVRVRHHDRPRRRRPSRCDRESRRRQRVRSRPERRTRSPSSPAAPGVARSTGELNNCLPGARLRRRRMRDGDRARLIGAEQPHGQSRWRTTSTWAAATRSPSCTEMRGVVDPARRPGRLHRESGRPPVTDCTSQAGIGISSVGSLAVSPDGRNLYSASTDATGAVAEFARNANGSLTQLGGANSCIEENATGQGGARGRGVRHPDRTWPRRWQTRSG